MDDFAQMIVFHYSATKRAEPRGSPTHATLRECGLPSQPATALRPAGYHSLFHSGHCNFPAMGGDMAKRWFPALFALVLAACGEPEVAPALSCVPHDDGLAFWRQGLSGVSPLSAPSLAAFLVDVPPQQAGRVTGRVLLGAHAFMVLVTRVGSRRHQHAQDGKGIRAIAIHGH